MSAEGFFHDAHEVYTRPVGKLTWNWTATFATKELALSYGVVVDKTNIDAPYYVEWELRPV